MTRIFTIIVKLVTLLAVIHVALGLSGWNLLLDTTPSFCVKVEHTDFETGNTVVSDCIPDMSYADTSVDGSAVAASGLYVVQMSDTNNHNHIASFRFDEEKGVIEQLSMCQVNGSFIIGGFILDPANPKYLILTMYSGIYGTPYMYRLAVGGSNSTNPSLLCSFELISGALTAYADTYVERISPTDATYFVHASYDSDFLLLKEDAAGNFSTQIIKEPNDWPSKMPIIDTMTLQPTATESQLLMELKWDPARTPHPNNGLWRLDIDYSSGNSTATSLVTRDDNRLIGDTVFSGAGDFNSDDNENAVFWRWGDVKTDFKATSMIIDPQTGEEKVLSTIATSMKGPDLQRSGFRVC